MSYPDLDSLLQKEDAAKKYFDKLPDFAQQQIRTRAQNVNTFEGLKNYAENILRGDG